MDRGRLAPKIRDLDLWKDDVFGNATRSPRHTVTGGRFAYQRITKVDPTSQITHNAYGYMRAPWNVNRSPYLTRARDGAGRSHLPISAAFRSFRLIVGRAIIPRSALEACMLLLERARADRSR